MPGAARALALSASSDSARLNLPVMRISRSTFPSAIGWIAKGQVLVQRKTPESQISRF